MAQFARSCSVGALRIAWTITYMAATAPRIENIDKDFRSAAMIFATLSLGPTRRQFALKSALLPPVLDTFHIRIDPSLLSALSNP